ncbi:conserved hypothetical protein, partial [Ricinus communis]
HVIAGVGQADQQVLAQAADEQAVILLQIADVLVQGETVDVGHVQAIEQDASLLRAIQSRQQAQDGGLAGADRPQHGHALTCVDGQLVDGHGVEHAAGVGELGLFDAELTAQVVWGELSLAALVGLQGVDLFQPGQRGLGVGALHHQAGNHRYRRQDAAAQDGTGDERAHGDLAIDDQEGADDDGGGIAQLLQGRGDIAGMVADGAHGHVAADGFGADVDPAREELPAAGTGLDGLDAFHRLHQQAGLEVGGSRTLVGQPCHLAVGEVADQDGDHTEDGRHQRHPGAGDKGDHQYEQQAQRQVDQGEQGLRGVEGADLFIAAQLAGQAAHGTGQLIDPHGQQALIERLRQLGVEAGNHLVHDVGAGELHAQLEQDGQAHADGQHDQGGHAVGGDDAVIDLHGEDRRAQRDDAHHHRGHDDLDEHRAELADGVQEDPLETLLPLLAALLGEVQAVAAADDLGIAHHALAGVAEEVPTPVRALVHQQPPALLLDLAQQRQARSVGLGQVTRARQ